MIPATLSRRLASRLAANPASSARPVGLRCLSRVRKRAAAGEAGLNFPAALRALRLTAKPRGFDETVEIALRLGLDPRKPDQQLRSVVELPHGTGQVTRVVVFAEGEAAAEASAAGADIVGGAELAERIQGGFTDFERCIAHPSMMREVGKLGKVLGPRGLMPNAKLGTVTTSLAKAVKSAKQGVVEFKAERHGLVCAPIGKLSFEDESLVGNMRELMMAINDNKPKASHSTLIQPSFNPQSTTTSPR